MRLSELQQEPMEDLRAWSSTAEFRSKLARASEVIRAWLQSASRPAISCGGGKDSTAVALLVRAERRDVPIFCAHPPNPMPDRAEHINRLCKYLGEPWINVPYPWNVESVLEGREAYPHLLKIRALTAAMDSCGIDSVAMGIRERESQSRRILAATRGELYRRKNGVVCLPVLRWKAEETLGFAMSIGAPVHPVYKKKHLMPSYEVLRDGTWWPHGLALSRGYRAWLNWHYPSVVESYDRAALVVERSAAV